MSSVLEAAVTRVSSSVQPLIFETGLSDAPYSQSGTVFLVGSKGRVFAVTARHALRPENPMPLCIFPSDGKRRFLPLKNVSFVPEHLAQADFTDLALVQVDLPAVASRHHGQSKIINLDGDLPNWNDHPDCTPFVFIGYPGERSFIDYEDCVMHSERVALYANFVGPAHSKHLYTLEVEDTKDLTSFSGFSGGPVFSWVRRLGKLPTLTPAGLLLQGTPQSRRVHFLEVSVIRDALAVW